MATGSDITITEDTIETAQLLPNEEPEPVSESPPKGTESPSNGSKSPQKEALIDVQATNQGNNCCYHCMEIICRRLTYFFCIFTGQFAFTNPSPNKSSLITLYFFFITLLCFILNLAPFALTIADWATCTSKHYNVYYNVCYSIVLHPEPQTDHIPNIILDYKNYSANSLSDNEDNLKKFTIYARVMLLITSFSGITSYLFFVIAFMKLFFFPHLKKAGIPGIKRATDIINTIWCIKEEDEGGDNRAAGDNEGGEDNEGEGDNGREGLLADVKPLHPFDDQDNSKIDIKIADIDNSTSTRLSEPYQAVSYYSVLAVNIAINIAMLVVFVIGQYAIYPKIDDSNTTKKTQKYEIVGVTCYIYSLFCTLFSCFIFSKLAYGIQNKYKSLNTKYLKHVNTNDENQLQEIRDVLRKIDARDHTNDDVLRVKLQYLQERDKHFSKVAKSTIKQFEFWFFFHWILYIVSSFLSLSLFFEVLIYYINSSLPNQTSTTGGIDFHPLEIIFLGFFSASNVLFFLYPCIRAASVTNSRQVQISELNKIYMKYEHVSPELKDRFAEFLKSQNAGFDLHILCARVPFGFSVAYISIFIALFSVLLKVASSI